MYRGSLLATISCKAQSPIIGFEEYENNDVIELTDGCYLKDTTGNFTPVLGTWKWTEGNNELAINFEKIEMVNNGSFYSDYIVGKYKYRDQ